MYGLPDWLFPSVKLTKLHRYDAQSYDFSLPPPPPDEMPNLTDLPKYLYLSVIASTLILTVFLVLWTCYLFLLHVGRKRTLARRYAEFRDKTLEEKELEKTDFRQRLEAEEAARLRESLEGKEHKSEEEKSKEKPKSRIQYLLDRELKAEEKKKEKFSRGLRRMGSRNSYDERGKEEARIGQEKEE